MGSDTAAESYLHLPGLLEYNRDNNRLQLGRASNQYILDLSSQSPDFFTLSQPWRRFNQYRFLSATLKHSGYDRPYTHLECPDTNRVLQGFRLTELIDPSCYYD